MRPHLDVFRIVQNEVCDSVILHLTHEIEGTIRVGNEGFVVEDQPETSEHSGPDVYSLPFAHTKE